MRISLVAAAVSLVLVGLAQAQHAQAAMRMPTGIAPQPLRTALQKFSAERDLQLIFRTDVVGDITTRGAKGDLTAEETLRQLLVGTGLTYQFLDDHTVTVQPEHLTSNATLTSSATEGPAGQLLGSVWDRFRVGEAQQQGADAPSISGGAAPSSVEGPAYPVALQEVVVTAEKKSERLLDVPGSLSVLTGDDLASRGASAASDYLRGLPGVNLNASVGGDSITIRGLSTVPSGANFSSGATTATYFGETQVTGSTGLNGESNDLRTVDVSRVEVLKGPQGTLFGASSIGGVVRIVPNPPQLGELRGGIEASYSDTERFGSDNHSAQAFINIPLGNVFALRIVGYTFEDSGYYKNLAGSDPQFQSIVVAPFGAQAYAHDEDHVGSHTTTGGRASLLFQPTEDLKATAGFIVQQDTIDGFGTSTNGNYQFVSLDIAAQHDGGTPTTGRGDSSTRIANATVEYKLQTLDILGTYSHLHGEGIYAGTFTDNPVFPTPPFAAADFYGDSLNTQDQFELRANSHFDGPLNFLVGAYYENVVDDYHSQYVWTGDPAKNTFQPGATLIGLYHQKRNSQQTAGFGEAYWKIVPALTLTGGVRAYQYDRTFKIDYPTSPFLGGGTSLNDKDHASGALFKTNLAYKPSANSTAYVAFSQGYRPGRPQAEPYLGATCDTNGDGIIDSSNLSLSTVNNVAADKTNNYEVGYKFSGFSSRIATTVSVFQVDWNNIPVYSTIGKCQFSVLLNAGSARSRGVEWQTNFQATRAIHGYFGSSYIDAHLTSALPGAGLAAGAQLPGSPKWNANFGLEYKFQLAGVEESFNADGIYVGTLYSTLPPGTEGGDYVKLDLALKTYIKSATVSLFVNNVTNSSAFTLPPAGSSYGYQLQPRTVGVRVATDF